MLWQHNGIDLPRVPGSLHAAEHAAIGLLPLVASCDRGDIGGMSTAIGPDGLPRVFVYDGYPGGAGFAERGFRRARTWLGATAAAIEACECPSGCPPCVQVPEMRQRQRPVGQGGAVLVLRLVLAELAGDRNGSRNPAPCGKSSRSQGQSLSNPADGDRPLDGRPPRICITTAASRRYFLTAEKPACVAQRDERSDNHEPFAVPTTRAHQQTYSPPRRGAQLTAVPKPDTLHPSGRTIDYMAHDWLLVETLGDEPAVVAQGQQLKNLVPIPPSCAAVPISPRSGMRSPSRYRPDRA